MIAAAGGVARIEELHPAAAGFGPAKFERNKTVRIEAFSGGVFAIAITLLVLGIAVPKAKDLDAGGSLGSTLLKLWHHYRTCLWKAGCPRFRCRQRTWQQEKSRNGV